ncbi:MAG: DUF2505 family protein [Sandaracinus sp.]
MKTITQSFVLPCRIETVWKAYLDPAYVRALYLETLGYRGLDVLEMTESSRKMRVVPKLALPAPIQKLIGDSFAYEDHGALDRAKNVWTWQMVQPSQLAPGAKPKPGIVTTRGVVRLEAVGERECRRTDELTIEANVFGIGGMVESAAEKEARAGWALEVPMITRWVQRLEA